LLAKKGRGKTAGKPQYQVGVFISASRVSGAKISLPEAPIEINFACFFLERLFLTHSLDQPIIV